MATVVTSGKYQRPPHVGFINGWIRKLVRRDIPERVLVIRMPPRHGKSELISHWTTAWHMANWPQKNVLLASYEATFASYWGRKARDSFVEAVSRHPDVLVGRPDQTRAAASDWGTKHGGYMATAGVGGPFTGKGGHLLVADDLIKNAEEAQSETYRRKTWEWFTSTFWSRLEPGGVMLVIGTPWHRDDYLARLRDWDEPIREINLPAIAGSDDHLKRTEGEALWPERFDEAALEKIRLSQGPYYWSALYQCKPTLHESAEWPAEYFDDIFIERMPHAFELSAIGVDPSKGREKGDYWASVFAGVNGGTIYVDALMGRMPAELGIQRTTELSLKYGADVVGVESVQFQELLAPMIEAYVSKHRLPPFEVAQLTDNTPKPVRIRRVGAWLAQRRVRFLDTPDNRLLVSQLQDFPLGDHDDGPDALEMAIRLLGELARFASGVTDEYEELV